MGESEEFTRQLLATHEEYRELASKHSELEGRLQELITKHYLSDSEQLEEVTLKKRKLRVKDRMEEIARGQNGGTRSPFISA